MAIQTYPTFILDRLAGPQVPFEKNSGVFWKKTINWKTPRWGIKNSGDETRENKDVFGGSRLVSNGTGYNFLEIIYEILQIKSVDNKLKIK